MNDFFVTGNLTKDPEFSVTKNGTSLLKGDVADNQFYKGEKKTSYWGFVMYGKQAEFFQQKLHKGIPVYLSGELEQQRWEYEGKQYSKVVLNVRKAVAGQNLISEPSVAAPLDIDDIPF